MVEVNAHFLVSDLEDAAVETVAVFVDEGYDGIHMDDFLIQFSVTHEDVFVQFHDALLDVVAVGIVFGDDEVEFRALCEIGHRFLEEGEREAHAANEAERFFL